MKKEGSLNNIDLWSWILGIDAFNSGKSEKEKKQDANENIKMLRALDRFGKHLYSVCVCVCVCVCVSVCMYVRTYVCVYIYLDRYLELTLLYWSSLFFILYVCLSVCLCLSVCIIHQLRSEVPRGCFQVS